MNPHKTSRRTFLRSLPGVAASLALAARPLRAAGRRHEFASDHPEPRPGIDASGVLSADELKADDVPGETIALYDAVREMPEVADGLACYCGCMLVGNRSLLTCYGETGMARSCMICQGEARLAHRRWKEGQSLDQIRRAIDARFAR